MKRIIKKLTILKMDRLDTLSFFIGFVEELYKHCLEDKNFYSFLYTISSKYFSHIYKY